MEAQLGAPGVFVHLLCAVWLTHGEGSATAHDFAWMAYSTCNLQVSQLTGSQVFFKNEFLLPTGSFKERGARNALLLLPEEAKRRGVCAASAGEFTAVVGSDRATSE